MKPVSALELYQATPRTNCKECGFSTCLAFATRVIVEKKPLDACPYLDKARKDDLASTIYKQQEHGIYVKRDLYKITVDHIREQLKDHDFSAVAQGLGAELIEEEEELFLRFSYLNRDCRLSKRDVLLEGKSTGDHWDNILLYNYVNLSGREPLHNVWIPIDNIPGYIPKKPELEQGCEEKIARHFEGNLSRFKKAALTLSGKSAQDASHADAAFTFLPLPKVPFFLLFWDHAPEEGFTARAKLLFDRSVTHYLDIESLVFLAEKFAETLIEADQGLDQERD